MLYLYDTIILERRPRIIKISVLREFSVHLHMEHAWYLSVILHY